VNRVIEGAGAADHARTGAFRAYSRGRMSVREVVADQRPASEPAGTRRSEGLPQVAAAIAVAAWALAACSIALLIAARPQVSEGLWFLAVDVTVAAVYGTVAAVTLSRRRHPVPWLIAVTALGGGLAAFGYSYSQLAYARMAQGRGELPWLGLIEPLQGTAWVPGTLALFLVVPWLVRDDRLTRIAWAGLVTGAVITVTMTGLRITDADGGVIQLYAVVVAVGLLAAAEAAWRRLRGPEGERVGLGWLATGTAVMALSFLPLALFDAVMLPLWFTPSLHLAAQAVFPAAILVAVLRQRMWGLDLAISRAVVGGLLTVGLVLLYVGVTTVLTRLLPGSGTAQVIAAAAVAVAVQPSRLWLQRRVHTLVYGEGAEPSRAVRRLGRYLGRAESAEELLSGLVESVGTALRLESVTLEVDGVRAAAWGTPTSAPLNVPLTHRGGPVGTLLVTAPPGESLGARTLRSLDELAAVVSAGVVLARASQELADARDRLTSVRLEERRVIRRELHDGLGPSLAGIRLGLQGARNLIDRDPRTAGDLLAKLQDELDQRVDDVRALSRNLLPPVLDELGLGPALDELAARRKESGLDVQVRHTGTEGLDPRLAAAAYGIAVEAVTNVARHAAAAWCLVDVTAGDELVVVVADDGRGIDPDAPAGVGTRSMRERAEEQGGTLRIDARRPRGTRVEARLPLGSG
jgi:signal transduction histidine kinase